MKNIFNSVFHVYVEDARMAPTKDETIVEALDYSTVINLQLCLHSESIGIIRTSTLEVDSYLTHY